MAHVNKPPSTIQLIVAAALVDANGRVLVQKRPMGREMAGLWEFPGGKIEDGETPEQALVRELAEELGITVSTSALSPLTFATHDMPSRTLILMLYLCRDWVGTPHPIDAECLGWFEPAQLRDLPMPPADIAFILALESQV